MSRSVVLAGTARCEHCRLPPRWCVCQALPPVASPLQVDVLMHQREQWRPTSTGRLAGRVVRGARVHVFQRGSSPDRASIVDPGSELWILHPRGEPLAAVATPPLDLTRVQVLLLDGSWGEAGDMLRVVEPWGRRICLPLAGPSRYWLREQQGEGRLSTVEALLGLLNALSLGNAEDQLRLHFELHVYASLRARGQKSQAATYLETSPIKAVLPNLLNQLSARRPNSTSYPVRDR